MGTLSLEQSRHRIHFYICLILHKSYMLSTLDLPRYLLTKIMLALPPYRLVRGEPPFSDIIRYLHYNSTIKLLLPLIVIIW